MAKLTGYIIALVGLVIVVLSLNLGRLNITLPAAIKSSYVMILGLVLIIVGVFLSLNKGKSTQAAEEVPIYHGNKIVGYRRQK